MGLKSSLTENCSTGTTGLFTLPEITPKVFPITSYSFIIFFSRKILFGFGNFIVT